MYDCIRCEERQEWEFLRSKDCNDSFSKDPCSKFFPRICCAKHRKHDEREPGLFKEEFQCTEMFCLFSKTHSCYKSLGNRFLFSSKGLNKLTFENRGEGPMAKNWKVFGETQNPTSTNRGFCTKNHCVATYEKTNKWLSCFYPKQIVESDGIQTVPLKA